MNTLNWDQIYTLAPAEELPAGIKPLTELALTIMIGLTGVGKTTVLRLLVDNGFPLTILPNRREITDKIIIASLQDKDGQTSHPVTDRLARFEYTARYRAKYAGGMAHALSRLALNPTNVTNHLIFDGLRGLNEVEYAAVYFPQARFVVLDAPDLIRLNRLLNRADAFDMATVPAMSISDNFVSALNKISHIEASFAPDQLRQIVALADNGLASADEVLKKVSIIVKERHNYDSHAARTYLTRTLPPGQVLVIDTATQPIQTVTERIERWLSVEK